jgi:toxin ParE1/3/4
MSRIVRRRAARQDLADIVYHYVSTASLDTARRFRAEAQATLQRLAAMPGMGARYEHEHPALTGLRFFPLSRFRNYLIFYRPLADGIEVVRVLHGARDIPRLLAEGMGVDEQAADDDPEGEPGEA